MGFSNNGLVIIPLINNNTDNVVDISCGLYFSIIKNKNNEAFSFGLNNKGTYL